MADRMVVMRDGVVEQEGTPLEIFDYPRNRFVASFIGSPAMNFIEGQIVRDKGGSTFRSKGGLNLPVEPSLAAQNDGRSVIYGVRPEHLVLSDDKQLIRASVLVLEPTGSETHIVAQAGKETIVALLRERMSAQPGSELMLGVQSGCDHLFDPQSGERLKLNRT